NDGGAWFDDPEPDEWYSGRYCARISWFRAIVMAESASAALSPWSISAARSPWSSVRNSEARTAECGTGPTMADTRLGALRLAPLTTSEPVTDTTGCPWNEPLPGASSPASAVLNAADWIAAESSISYEPAARGWANSSVTVWSTAVA